MRCRNGSNAPLSWTLSTALALLQRYGIQTTLERLKVSMVDTPSGPQPPCAKEAAELVVRYGMTALFEAELQTQAKARLTPYLVPRRFIQVAELPRTINGKLVAK